jgi:hypothetical protein
MARVSLSIATSPCPVNATTPKPVSASAMSSLPLPAFSTYVQLWRFSLPAWWYRAEYDAIGIFGFMTGVDRVHRCRYALPNGFNRATMD